VPNLFQTLPSIQVKRSRVALPSYCFSVIGGHGKLTTLVQ
jgi:hypothetical protein